MVPKPDEKPADPAVVAIWMLPDPLAAMPELARRDCWETVLVPLPVYGGGGLSTVAVMVASQSAKSGALAVSVSLRGT